MEAFGDLLQMALSLAAGLWPGQARAHPHVFVDTALTVELDAQQRIVIGASALLSTSNFDFDYLAMRLENSNDTILKSTFGGQLQ